MTNRAIAAIIAALMLAVIGTTTVQAVQRSGVEKCNAEDHPTNLPCLFITEEGRDFYVDENGSAYHLDTFEKATSGGVRERWDSFRHHPWP